MGYQQKAEQAARIALYNNLLRDAEANSILNSEAPKTEDSSTQNNANGNVRDMASITAVSGRGTIHCLTIVGQIEGHTMLPPQNKATKYEHIIPTLVAVEESPEIDGLLILLNTVGGDVEAGLAIAELISTMSKPTVSLVLGGGHSIGVPLAVSAKRSFIVPTATMTIHPVRMNGLVVGVPQTMNYFDRMQDRIISFVTGHSKISTRRMKELMFKTGELSTDAGSVLSGKEAVTEGLMGSLGGLSDALDCLYAQIAEYQPQKDALLNEAREAIEQAKQMAATPKKKTTRRKKATKTTK